MNRVAQVIFLSMFLLGPSSPSLFADAGKLRPVFDIPKLEAAVIDGQPADWRDRGFRVEQMDYEGGVPSVQDFDPCFRLGWDDRGLLLLVTVRNHPRNVSEARSCRNPLIPLATARKTS